MVDSAQRTQVIERLLAASDAKLAAADVDDVTTLDFDALAAAVAKGSFAVAVDATSVYWTSPDDGKVMKLTPK